MNLGIAVVHGPAADCVRAKEARLLFVAHASLPLIVVMQR